MDPTKIQPFTTAGLPTEGEITSRWKDWTPGGTIKVSILCAAYNHEHTIHDTLCGFLSQKTDFPFEIIVHDDASTDYTQEVVRQFTSRYPNLIRPILQTENQLSKGIDPYVHTSFSVATGEYVAFSEGDDYWIAEDKLQRQVDALEQSTQDICFHPALRVSYPTMSIDFLSYFGEFAFVVPLEDVILEGGGLMPTTSVLIRASAMRQPWLQEISAFQAMDVFIQISGANKAGALYIPVANAVYRHRTPGSWSESTKSVDRIISNYRYILSSFSTIWENLNTDKSIYYKKVATLEFGIATVFFASWAPFSALAHYGKSFCLSPTICIRLTGRALGKLIKRGFTLANATPERQAVDVQGTARVQNFRTPGRRG